MKAITLGDFIDNIEKNGYRQVKHQYIKGNPTSWFERTFKGAGACALGQGLINTFGKKVIQDFSHQRNILDYLKINYPYLVGHTIAANDVYRMPIFKIVNDLRYEYKDRLNEIIWSEQ